MEILLRKNKLKIDGNPKNRPSRPGFFSLFNKKAGRFFFTAIMILIALFLIQAAVSAQGYPVKRLQLKNGLTVLLKRIPESPAVSICMVYRVGSRNEKLGITGISHLLEHMLYKGTAKYSKDKMGKLLNRVGADFNAFTSNDVTGFYQTVAPEYMELAMHIEADRMKSGLISKNELHVEKKITLDEMAGYKNKSSFLLWKQVLGSAYMHHPYMWPVQGNENDISKLTAPQVKWYYNTYYQPNNAVLAVVGNFDEKKTLTLINKFFKDQKNLTSNIPGVIATEPPQAGEKLVILKNSGSAPLLHVAYHSPAIRDNDLYAMSLIDLLLTGGSSSRLRRALVEKGLAASASSWLDTSLDPGLFYLRLTLKKDGDHEKVEQALFQEIKRLETELVDERELQKAKNHLKAQFIKANDSITHQAQYMAWYESIYSYKYLTDFPGRIDRITAADIQQAAAKYLTRENRTIGRLYPRGSSAPEAAPEIDEDNRKSPQDDETSLNARMISHIPPGSGNIFGRANLKTPVEINMMENPDGIVDSNFLQAFPDGPYLLAAKPNKKYFQSSKKKTKKTSKSKANAKKKPKPKPRPKPRPKPKPYSPPIPVPGAFNLNFVRHKLPNGITLVIHRNDMNPSVSIHGAIKAGGMYEPADKAGLSKITAYMIPRGSENMPAGKLSEELDYLGAEMKFNSKLQTADFYVWTLPEHLEEVTGKLAATLKAPAFPENQLNRLKSLMQTRLKLMKDRPSIIAMKDFFEEVFPDNHPFHHFRWGNTNTLSAITRDDLVKFYKTYYRPESTIISISGNVDPRKVIQVFEKEFSDWKAEGQAPPIIMPPVTLPASDKTKVADIPNKARAEIVMGHPGISRNHPDYYKFNLLNHILGGGALVSRLGRAVRDKGLAYKIFSRLDVSMGEGPWAVQASSSPAKVQQVIRAVQAQVKYIRQNPVTKVELSDAKYSLIGGLPVYLENNDNITRMLLTIEYYNLGEDYLKNYSKTYNSITQADLLETAKKYLHPDKMFIIISGSIKE